MDEKFSYKLFAKIYISAYNGFMLMTCLSGPSVENYWTAGMYSQHAKRWYWYDEDNHPTVPQVYTKWKGIRPPTPSDEWDVCSTLTINSTAATDYWENQNCVKLNYYICELPKLCM